MSVPPAHGFADLLPGASWVEFTSCAARIALLTVTSSAVFVGAGIWVAQTMRSKALKHLQGLPQIREHFPFQTVWIFARACDQPMSPAGFSALLFDALRGFHATFQSSGWFLCFLGFMPTLMIYKAENSLRRTKIQIGVQRRATESSFLQQ